MIKISTGIEGLDRMLKGGLIRGRWILRVLSPCSKLSSINPFRTDS